MASMPCVYCHRVPKARLYTLIWAWQSAEGRVAIKTRSCAADVATAVLALGTPLPEEGDYIELPTSCPDCQEPLAAGDVAMTWLTHWDGDGEHRPTFAQCYACASQFRAALREQGETLPDRQPQNGRRGR